MTKKDFKQITIIFVILTVANLAFFYYLEKKDFTGLCTDQYLGPSHPCTFQESFNGIFWALLFGWSVLYVFTLIISQVTRTLNKYGFHAPPGQRGVMPFISFFIALKNWANNKPVNYPDTNDEINKLNN